MRDSNPLWGDEIFPADATINTNKWAPYVRQNLPCESYHTEMIKNSQLLLVDTDDYTSSLLLHSLQSRGLEQVVRISKSLELPRALAHATPDLIVFNYHFDQPDGLTLCSTIKLMAPQSVTVVIVSPGPALKAVQAWAKLTKSIDAVIEKPMSDSRFFGVLEELLGAMALTRESAEKTRRLANLIPDAALSVLENNSTTKAEAFEAVVLFTDIRESSRLIREMPTPDFFQVLNQLLSSQGRLISQFDGSVIKYTGDGVMAIFRGMGRSYLALRCALELAKINRDHKLPFGVGVAQGLVLAGLLGDSNQVGQRRQYDVIGATVHLASRLCSMANAGEVIATQGINTVAKINNPLPQSVASISVRGFDKAIDCVTFGPST